MSDQVQENVGELPAGMEKWGTDLAKLHAQHASAAESARQTPEVVRTALSPRLVQVAGRELHRFTIQTYINLEEISSPFLSGGASRLRDIIRALWVMVERDELVEETIYRGEDAVRAAVREFALTIDLHQMAGIAEAIVAHVSAAFAPSAELSSPSTTEGGGSPKVFSETAPAGS